jgi:Helix-turn-helix domain
VTPPPLDRFEWERLIRELDLPPTLKCTAYALATYANGDGTKARPGVDRLAHATGLSRRSVLAALAGLETAGLIEAVTRGGGKGTPRGFASVYVLSVPDNDPT